jgi:hypothetical protein
VLDVMIAALRAGSSRSAVTDKNKPAQPLGKPRVEPGQTMRSKARLRMRTYPFALSPWTKPVNLWTLGGITNSLQNRGLSCVCSSNNEHSELDIVGNFWEVLLCVHSTSALKRWGNPVRGVRLLGIAATMWNLCTLVCGSGTCCTNRMQIL